MDTVLNTTLFQVDEEVQWEPAGEGIQRQVYGYDDKIMMVKVKFEKGAIGSMHQHPHTQVSYIESGSFELTIGDVKKVLKEGDGYFVPSNVLHECKCLEAGLLVDVFTPLREDFINK